MLTVREKFIAHYVSTNLVGMMDNQSQEAVDAVVEKILVTRLRGLSEREVDEIIEELNYEFLICGEALITLRKIKRKRKRNDWRKTLR